MVNKKIGKMKKRVIFELIQSEEIMSMQQSQIEKEDEFSQAQFSNSTRIVWMTIIKIFLVSIIGLWQVFSLRRFFKEKNLI